MFDALSHGTLYDTFQRTVARWADRPAYAVPPMPGRSYHPEGMEMTWRETAEGVARMKARYAAAGYGLGHRVSILFEQRPEFFFHYYALNALGVSVVPINPDYRREEIAYVVEHSESCLAVAVDNRLEDMQAVSATLGGTLPVLSFDDFPEVLPKAPTPAQAGKPDGTTEAALLLSLIHI